MMVVPADAFRPRLLQQVETALIVEPCQEGITLVEFCRRGSPRGEVDTSDSLEKSVQLERPMLRGTVWHCSSGSFPDECVVKYFGCCRAVVAPFPKRPRYPFAQRCGRAPLSREDAS